MSQTDGLQTKITNVKMLATSSILSTMYVISPDRFSAKAAMNSAVQAVIFMTNSPMIIKRL